eukprot:1104269-Pelagomonas_calceolata.AAC.1
MGGTDLYLEQHFRAQDRHWSKNKALLDIKHKITHCRKESLPGVEVRHRRFRLTQKSTRLPAGADFFCSSLLKLRAHARAQGNGFRECCA